MTIDTVIDTIDSKRYQRLETLIQGLHALLDKYRSADYTCPRDESDSFMCGAFLLGALTKGMDSLRLLSPRPEVPFSGLSLLHLCGKIRALESPEWVNYTRSRYRESHGCTLHEVTETLVHSARL